MTLADQKLVEPLAEMLTHLVAGFDRAIPAKRRLETLWAHLRASRHEVPHAEAKSALLDLAEMSGLIRDLDRHGRAVVHHVIDWGLHGRDPFEQPVRGRPDQRPVRRDAHDCERARRTAAKGRVPVEVLLLRALVHGPETIVQPENLVLLRDLHCRDPDRFMQVRAELENLGIPRDQIMGAVLPLNEQAFVALDRAVGLAPRGQRARVFEGVVAVAAALVHGNVITKFDAVEYLLAIARTHASHAVHVARCARVVRAAFTNITPLEEGN